MKYNNRLFPYPVLGIEDDVLGEFSCDLTYKSDKNNITIIPQFKLIEESIMRMLSEKKANFVTQIYCRSTMLREIYTSANTIPDPIVMDALKLKNEVEVDFFICSTEENSKFFSKNFNPEYKNSSFSIDNSDIIAYGGKGKFYANKSPEELKSVSSLIRVKNMNVKNKPMYNEYESEKIEIMLCAEDYDNYQIIVKSRLAKNFIHSSIVLPALIDALYFMEKKEADEYEDKRWYKALTEIKNKSKTKDNFQIAQNILDQPSYRMFETVLTLIEEI
ncbi:MAG TPA: hypothetical protein VG367_10950 [Mucilaginibacter sp.]|jgi:hypothetical protein|nr:hypothetical protein [Mucilaginibacter sp.]